MHILAAIAYIQNLLLEARAVAFLTNELYIRKKLHLYRNRAIALANFAATAGQVEGEARRIESTPLSLTC